MKYKLIENTKIKMKNSQLHQDILTGTKTTKNNRRKHHTKTNKSPELPRKSVIEKCTKVTKKSDIKISLTKGIKML